MAWHTNQRGFFTGLPPVLPESVTPLLDDFTRFNEVSLSLAKQATEMRAKREQVSRDHEAAIAEAMLAGSKKEPLSPLPDWDRAIEDLDHRAAGARRAAAERYAEIGRALIASRDEDLHTLESELVTLVAAALDGVEALRPQLDAVTEALARHRWHEEVTHSRVPGWAPGTGEGKVMGDALGQIISSLRRINADLNPPQELVKQEATA
jgi:hypothetical protein